MPKSFDCGSYSGFRRHGMSFLAPGKPTDNGFRRNFVVLYTDRTNMWFPFGQKFVGNQNNHGSAIIEVVGAEGTNSWIFFGVKNFIARLRLSDWPGKGNQCRSSESKSHYVLN